MTALSPIAWTIDGYPLELAPDWTCSARVNEGFDAFRGTARSAEALAARGVDQGSIVTGWLPSGVLWQGELTAPPRLFGGGAELAANGFAARLRRSSRRLLFQSRDVGLWTDASVPPFNRTAAHSLRGTAENGAITFEVMQASVSQNDAYPVQVWVPGASLRRVAFTQDVSAADPDYKVRVHSAATKDSTARDQTDVTIADASSSTITLSSPGEVVIASLVRTGSSTTTASRMVVRLVDVRINDLAAGDSATAGDVFAVVAGLFGFDDAAVVRAGQNVLPIDHTGGSVGDLLDVVARLEGRRWLLLEDRGVGPRFEYGDWLRTWHVNEWGAARSLTPMSIINRAVVNYSTQAGTPAQVIVDADPDPLRGRGIVAHEVTLHEPQPDDGLAQATARATLSDLGRRRYRGQVKIIAATDGGGVTQPYEVRPGDLLQIDDLGITEASGPLRIVAADYTAEGVTATLEEDRRADMMILGGA